MVIRDPRSAGTAAAHIDVGSYDQHYAPSFFETKAGAHARSVAVFEVKPEINKTYADYTGDKIASVGALHRTNGDFRHLHGVSMDQDTTVKQILGGILTVRSGWVDMEGKAPVNALNSFDSLRRDLGIALDALVFDIREGDIEFSEQGIQLIFCAMRLFHRLPGCQLRLTRRFGS